MVYWKNLKKGEAVELVGSHYESGGSEVYWHADESRDAKAQLRRLAGK